MNFKITMTDTALPGAPPVENPKTVEFVLDLTDGEGKTIWDGYTGMRDLQANDDQPTTHEFKVVKTMADPLVDQVRECLDLFALWMKDPHAEKVKTVVSVQFARDDEPYNQNALEQALYQL